MMRYFIGIVAASRRDGIDLRLLISPAHARLEDMLAATAGWEAYEQWKRELVAVLAADAAAHPEAQPFPLWDFSGYNSVTTEVPSAADMEGQMRWYWEPSHYRTRTGDLILDRIFSHHDPARPVPRDFGVLLTPANIDSHLQNVRLARETWRAFDNRQSNLSALIDPSTVQ